MNKRRAVAAQTARSRCKFRYALFRDYRQTHASRLLESETRESRVLKLSLGNTTRIDGRILRTTCDSATNVGLSRLLFPADSKRLQYTITQLNSKDGIVRKIYCRVAFVTTYYSSSRLSFLLTALSSTGHNFKFKFTGCDVKSVQQINNNNNNNNNTLIYIAPACRMTSEALADSSSRATECLTEK